MKSTRTVSKTITTQQLLSYMNEINAALPPDEETTNPTALQRCNEAILLGIKYFHEVQEGTIGDEEWRKAYADLMYTIAITFTTKWDVLNTAPLTLKQYTLEIPVYIPEYKLWQDAIKYSEETFKGLKKDLESSFGKEMRENIKLIQSLQKSVLEQKDELTDLFAHTQKTLQKKVATATGPAKTKGKKRKCPEVSSSSSSSSSSNLPPTNKSRWLLNTTLHETKTQLEAANTDLRAEKEKSQQLKKELDSVALITQRLTEELKTAQATSERDKTSFSEFKASAELERKNLEANLRSLRAECDDSKPLRWESLSLNPSDDGLSDLSDLAPYLRLT